MKLLEAIYSKLNNDAGVSALVSDRIYPLSAPEAATDAENVYPMVLYTLVSEATLTDFGGDFINDARVQIDAYAATLKEALEAASAVFGCLHGYAGEIEEIDAGYILRQNRRIEHEAGDTLYRVSEDYRIGYKDAS